MDNWNLQPARDLGLTAGQRMRSLQRESGLMSSTMHWGWWTLVRGYLTVWHRLSISGQHHLPAAPPYVLAANHTSHLDALILAASLPWHCRASVFPIAAGDVFFETPLRSAFSAVVLNALPMWRKKCGPHALEELRQRLLDGSAIYVLFPEGARSRDGTLQRFKAGLGMLLAETNVPVVPCHLQGCFEALPANAHWPRPRRIRLTLGPSRHFADTRNDRAGWMHVAATLEEAIRALAPTEPRPQGGNSMD
jgi:1-acyl-sn-glycerol-3-phosphate acyltransferase